MSIPINKTLDEIRTEMFARIETIQDEYAAKGWLPVRLNLNKGVFRGLIELWCWGLHQLYLFLAYILTMAFPLLSEEAWLELHAGQVELTKKAATKASGTVVFTRVGTTGNVPIPAGRIVRTQPDALGKVYRFVTTAASVLLDGTTPKSSPRSRALTGLRTGRAGYRARDRIPRRTRRCKSGIAWPGRVTTA